MMTFPGECKNKKTKDVFIFKPVILMAFYSGGHDCFYVKKCFFSTLIAKKRRKLFFQIDHFERVLEKQTTCVLVKKSCFSTLIAKKRRRLVFFKSVFLNVFWKSGQHVFWSKKTVFPRILLKTEENYFFQIDLFERVLEKRTTCVLVKKSCFFHVDC